ncbi:MAG: T9SS type A sorting domain-containing protein [Crocinitomicaceae bacterium]|nr:T9SS type A sorting domain-containing protein [Crocinitomicaceae bacterium]
MTGRFYGATDLGIKAPITTVDSYADAFVHKRSKAYLNIPEQNIKQSMFVYPNPTNGVINFSLKDYSVIEITNLMGQVVYATSLEAGSSSLNIEFLPDGIYSFRILSENENRCVQVIKN